MKIRNGFVSNSSSSSFMIVTPKGTINKVLGNFSSAQRKFIKEFLPLKGTAKLNGCDYETYCSTLYSDSLYDMWSTFFGEEEYDGELWDRFLETLEKEDNTCVQYGE